MAEPVDSTQRIWETMKPLLSYLAAGPATNTDLEQLLTLILRMMEKYPPILVSCIQLAVLWLRILFRVPVLDPTHFS